MLQNRYKGVSTGYRRRHPSPEDRPFLVATLGPSGFLRFIRWRRNARQNVDILNDTSDLYRYADVSHQARFLSACVLDAVFRDIPDEVEAVRRLDAAADETRERLETCLREFPEVPKRRMELLVKIVTSLGGPLSKTKRKLFPDLPDHDISAIESIVLGSPVFEGTVPAP